MEPTGQHPDTKVTLAIGTRAPRALDRTERAAVELTPIDGGRRGQPAAPAGVVARDALERVLRDVRRVPIGVVGRHAAAIVDWLRQTGSEAHVLPLPGAGPVPRRTGRQPAARWSVLIAAGCIEHADDPSALLSSLRRMLADDGRLVVVAANVTHASVRLAMLQGRYPLRGADGSGRAYPPSPADIERDLNAAGFVVTTAEPQVDAPDVLEELGASVPASVLAMLAQDGEAMTSHLAFVAVPEGASTVRLLHRHLRQLDDDQRTAARGTDRLASRVAELEVRVRHWAAETDALVLPGVPSAAALAAVETHVERIDVRQRDVHETLERLRRGIESLEERVRTTEHAQERVQTTIGAAAGAVQGLEAQVRALTDRADGSTAAGAARDAALREIRDRLVQRTGEMQALLRRVEQMRYRRLVGRFHGAVRGCTPAGATVAVVSRGDSDLLTLEGRRGWHFPQAKGGIYAGHHPADSAAAIAHLEELRRRGAAFLAIPRTAFWWLEHYREFNDHLARKYRCVLRQAHSCLVFDLAGGARAR